MDRVREIFDEGATIDRAACDEELLVRASVSDRNHVKTLSCRMNTISVRSKGPKQTTPRCCGTRPPTLQISDRIPKSTLQMAPACKPRGLLFRCTSNPPTLQTYAAGHLHPLFNSNLGKFDLQSPPTLQFQVKFDLQPTQFQVKFDLHTHFNSKLKNSTCNPHPLFNYNLGKFDLQSPPTLQLQLENFHRWHCHVEYIGRHGISLSGSYRQGYSTAYNTQSHIKVVYNGYILTHI